MTHIRFYTHCLIFTLILFLGLGLALVIPWIASSRSQAAQSEVGAQGSFMNLHVYGKGFRVSPEENTQLATDSEHAPEAITRYYVAKTGDGTNPTLGWTTAFTNVQDALAVAVETSEIWVAKGVYYPDEGSGQINNASISTFFMTDGVALYGGFDTSDSDITDRDWENNVTVLSGDIDGNDVTDANGVVSDTVDIRGINAYHVVTADGTAGTPITGSTVLDGLTITAGWATDWTGGGFYCDGSGSGNECSPSLANVTFSGNLAGIGGAMVNDGASNGTSSPSLTNVTFSGNSANGLGGAMYNWGSNGNSSPVVRNSILWNNQDSSGTGTITATIYNNNATITLTYSLAQGTGESSSWTSDSSYVNGGGNIDTDPMFVTPIDPSTAPTTSGNLRLQTGSPAVNAGNNSFVTVPTDLDGNERIIGCSVDMGAYETMGDYPCQIFEPLIFR